MIRKMIHIDEEKCNGCGMCAIACHEGAIDIVEGKAKLVRESFCDGFGDCLPNCPAGAIRFEEREAPAYDHAAVQKIQEENRMAAMSISVEDIMNIRDENERRKLMMAKLMEAGSASSHGECPGSKLMQLHNKTIFDEQEEMPEEKNTPIKPISRLNQWPCQIRLLPVKAPFYDGAKLLIAADCTAYAYADMHENFMKGRITLIGCPKLDNVDYTEKLTEIITNNEIQSIVIVRMEVPCCGGLQRAAENALKNSGKFIPWQVVTISRNGRIVD